MSITELLNEIGADKIQVQFLDECATDFEYNSKGTFVTFGTHAISVSEMAAGVMTKPGPVGGNMGIVCWVPRDKAEKIFKRIKK